MKIVTTATIVTQVPQDDAEWFRDLPEEEQKERLNRGKEDVVKLLQGEFGKDSEIEVTLTLEEDTE